eukprot:7007259-Pyramimonas_sp.AAC.1
MDPNKGNAARNDKETRTRAPTPPKGPPEGPPRARPRRACHPCRRAHAGYSAREESEASVCF